MQKSLRPDLIFFILLICLLKGFTNYAQVPVNLDTALIADLAPSDTLYENIVIGEIIITGYKKTKPYLIERDIPFKKGDIVKRTELNKLLELGRQQVMNTSLFVEASVKVINQISDIVYVEVNVKERWYLFPLPYFRMIDRNFNTWWVEHNHSLERINYGIEFLQNNVSGRNDNLNISLVNGYTQQFAVRYKNPFLDKDLVHGMNAGFSYSRNREVNYATNTLNKQLFVKQEDQFLINQLHFDLAYTYRPAIKTRHSFRIGYTDVRVKDTVLKLNPEYFPGSVTRLRFPDISYNVQYYNVDYIPYPLRGFTGEATIYKRFNSKDQLFQIGGKGTYTKKVLSNSYLQFQAAGLLRLPFKQSFVNQRLFGSSDFYMRGLEYYVIDGVAGGVLRGTAIQQVFNFNIPLPFSVKSINKIPFKIYAKTFSDLGYSYHPKQGHSILNNKLLRTWGIGLDIVSFYDIVFKLEYSFNQLGNNDLFFHTKSDF